MAAIRSDSIELLDVPTGAGMPLFPPVWGGQRYGMQGPANGALKGTRLEGPVHQVGDMPCISMEPLKELDWHKLAANHKGKYTRKLCKRNCNQLLRGAVMAPIKARTHVGVPNRLGTCVVQVGGCTAIAI